MPPGKHLRPKAVATYLEAAVAYMEAGGERRFQAPLIKHFGATSLATLDQAAIDRAAKLLYPSAMAGTLNRQVYTPASAVLKFAAKRGLCDFRQIERPRQPKGRIRWLTPTEADRLIEACSTHLRPLVIFLFYTGCRLSEGLYLDWAQVDLIRREVQFLETKNGRPRGVPCPDLSQIRSMVASGSIFVLLELSRRAQPELLP